MTFLKGVRRSSIGIAVALFAVSCMDASAGTEVAADVGAVKAGGSLVVTKLTSNQKDVAPNLAKSLVNGWGIVQFDGKFWIAANGSGDVVILDGKGVPSTGTPASGAISLGAGITGVAVTGAKANDTAFLIHPAKGYDGSKPAQLIFASENGKLIAVNTELSTKTGFVVVDRSKAGAIFKGVAVVPKTDGQHGKRAALILAADFHNGQVDVFDERFKLVKKPAFNVQLVEGFAPFNVMVFEDTVFVTYAKQDANKEDDVPGPGLGFVVAFDTSGKFLGLAKGPALNAPWGMVPAGNFGPFPNSLLVANFGDGHITAIAMPGTASGSTLTVLGQLKDHKGAPIAIDGLWGISFGTAVTNARPSGLYFAAGPDDEKNGLFGVIAPSKSGD